MCVKVRDLLEALATLDDRAGAAEEEAVFSSLGGRQDEGGQYFEGGQQDEGERQDEGEQTYLR